MPKTTRTSTISATTAEEENEKKQTTVCVAQNKSVRLI